MPMSAMPRARFCGVVQSAITAAAVPTLAPAMPAPMRDRSMSDSAVAARSGGNVTAYP
jgi:hypothetical protein